MFVIMSGKEKKDYEMSLTVLRGPLYKKAFEDIARYRPETAPLPRATTSIKVAGNWVIGDFHMTSLENY